MLYMAKLGPDVITEEINIDDEDSAMDRRMLPRLVSQYSVRSRSKGGILA